MSELGRLLPRMRERPPGPASRAWAERLGEVESRNVTDLSGEPPVFWSEARGANVRDADGNVYVDLTAAFGVALVGHGAPAVVEAVAARAGRLLHGMGDVHPTGLRVELLERLADRMPWEETRAVLASSGSEAVEIALKTALLRTGRAGILAFEGGYHGLTLGALAATARPYFRTPFRDRLYGGVTLAPWPAEGSDEEVEASLRVVRAALAGEGSRPRGPEPSGPPRSGRPVGALIVEPIQGRAGVRVPPPGFLAEVSRLAREHEAVVIADEVFTGCRRTGGFLASPAVGLEPDLVCLGKALGGGMPLSACLGRAEVMDAWPPSPGEALHTSTFLGHPASCAAALATLDLLNGELGDRIAPLGERLRAAVDLSLDGHAAVARVRGRGLMLGVELTGGEDGPAGAGAKLARAALGEGVIVLPAGERSEVVELTPPAVLTDAQLEAAVAGLGRAVEAAFGDAGRSA